MTQATTSETLPLELQSGGELAGLRVCMHVLGTARTDIRVLREATALQRAGAIVSIVDLEQDRTRPRQEKVDEVLLRHVMTPGYFVSTRFKPWFLIKFARVFLRGVLQALRTPADVYHAHDETALPACYVAAVLRRKPLIFDAHELPLVQPHLTRWRLLCAAARWSLKRMVARCSAVITVSPPLVDEFQRRYGGRTVALVRNMPEYQPVSSSDHLRRALGLGAESRIALYQGVLQANRSLDIVIRAARFLEPGHVIVLLGRGKLEGYLQALIQREGVEDRVKMLPPVPYKELLSWTASADLGLMIFRPDFSLSIQMCLPNKLFEYLMAGVPVLTSSLVAVEEIVSRYAVGKIVTSLGPEDVGRAISMLLADSEARAEMRKNALAASERDLRWDMECQHLVRLYQSVLAGAATVRTVSTPSVR